MYDNILVLTDGSKAAKRAAEHGVELAKETGGTVHALYVMDMGDADFVAVPSDIAETRKRLEKKGKEYTSVVSELASAADVECVTAVKTGVPPDEVLEYVRENDIDLITMGKRGRSDPDKHLIGSLTNRIMRISDVPVHAV